MTTTIIAGRFEQQDAAGDAVEEFVRAGFMRERLASFYVNPRGQHDAYLIGGDQEKSPGAKESGTGAAIGAAAGGAIGVAAAPLLGPVGVVTGGLVGAHVGGLVGSMSKMKERGESEESGDNEEDAGNAEPLRRSGMMVAAAVESDAQEEQALHLFRSLGAADIERSAGTIVNGDWTDFNPIEPPNLVGPPSDQTASGVTTEQRR